MNKFPSIAVVTTFPSNMFEVYGRGMIQSFVQYWPKEIPLLVQLDDELVSEQVGKMLRPQDAVAVGWTQEHKDFVERNSDKDDPQNYRKQVTRFCHKVFAIYRAYEAVKQQKETGGDVPRYLIWWDADCHTLRPVSMNEVEECLPNEGDAVSYLGRKDWPHSECGFMAFDLENGGGDFIEVFHGLYTSDEVLNLKETHDSWVFDHIRQSKESPKCTNLTEEKPGMDIWPHSPMGKWSTHNKGPVAKSRLAQPVQGLQIQTKNSVPDETIRQHIEENQKLITNWVEECTPTDEEIVVVSAGPMLVAEDVLKEKGKIVAVKHAIGPLKAAGITPWACILLDPRPHVYDFVEKPDPSVLWFVASQVNPRVTERLLAFGCTVWGYHAAVGAGEDDLTAKQPSAVVGGGSATATRGLYLLNRLGFKNFKLYGYDLCYPDKVDLNLRDEHGQPKYLEISIGWNNPLTNLKRCFWTEPQLIAQFEEINGIIQANIFNLEAYGEGIVPFVINQKKLGDLRLSKLKANINKKKISYGKLLKWKTTTSLMKRLRAFRIFRKTTKPKQ